MTDQEVYIEAMNNRLKDAETANKRNSETLEKLITLIQQRLGQLDSTELVTMLKESEEEAVQLNERAVNDIST